MWNFLEDYVNRTPVGNLKEHSLNESTNLRPSVEFHAVAYGPCRPVFYFALPNFPSFAE